MTSASRTRIRDLVELPRVRTVIQLADVADAALARSILEDFVLTADCDTALSALLDAMTADEGQGFFLQGNFGSGKSHLLALFELLFREETADAAWESLIRQNRRYDALRQSLAPPIRSTAIGAVSLVEHAGSERLEDICLAALTPMSPAQTDAVDEIRAAIETRHKNALERFLAARSVSAERVFDPDRPDLLDDLVRELDLPFRVRRQRGAFFDALEAELGKGEGSKRAVLVVDELSEFLRSKPDARAFNEDIRFLQFLGEASRRMPFFIVASLQEFIETTGEIDQATFGKIKDRFPSRLSLTGSHLREIASARLIRKLPGADAAINDIYHKFRAAFDGLSLSQSELTALYPVHPATVDLLDDLLPLFSRHRGAVDFLHYQLAGDPSRNIEGLLNAPAESLLGPDAIVDHFRVRIGETLETSPYVTVVLAFYEKELPRLFAEPEDRATALRLVKILILLAISPIRRRRTVAELAEMLLKSITTLDSTANYDHVKDLLDKMTLEGAYLSVTRGEGPYDDVFAIDLTADVQRILQRRVETFMNDPGFTVSRAVEMLLPFFKSPELPLASLVRSPVTERRVFWQKTPREGVLLFCRDESEPLLAGARLDELVEKLWTTELDFCVVLIAPGGASEPASLKALEERGGEAFVLWFPAPLEEGADKPAQLVRRAAARLAVKEHFENETSDVGKRVLATLEPLVREDVELAENFIHRAYRRGRFFVPGEAASSSPADLPSLITFDRVVERVAQLPLSRRYPKHYEVAPSLESSAADTSSPLLREFFRAGEVPRQNLAEPLRQTLDARLRTLGLVRRTATGYRLQPDPSENELVRFVLERVGNQRLEVEGLYREIRKGPFGLPRASFDLVVRGLVYSGQLAAYASGRKLSLDALESHSVRKIHELGPGEMLSSELQAVLARLPFVPPRLRDGAFGFAQQRELWDLVVSWRGELERLAADSKAELERARRYRSAATLDLEQIASLIERLESVAAEVKISYSAREGLERFARRVRDVPDLARDHDAFQSISRFFKEDWERYLFIQRYLHDPALELPEEHQDLIAARDRLRQLAARRDLPYAPESMRKLDEDMQAFVNDYGMTYEKAHRAEKSRERVKRLLSLREDKTYRLLQRLAALELISVDDDRAKVDRVLDEALARTCERLTPEILRSRPSCECGFRLGDRLELPAPSDARAMIDRGIGQYLARLRETAYREPVESALHGLSEVGKDALVAKVRALFELDLDAPDVLKRANPLVTSELVEALNDALAGHAVLVERRLDDLVERIEERSFTKQALVDLVVRWVDGGDTLSADDYVKVVARGTSGSGANALEALVREHYSELAPWWDEIGERRAETLIVLAFRGEEVEGLEPRLAERAREAFEALDKDAPHEAAQVIERVENALTDRERRSLLSAAVGDGGDDAETLCRLAFGERAFRFAVRARAAKLIRMVLSGSLATLPQSARVDRHDREWTRLGLAALSQALEAGVTVRRATRHLDDLAKAPETAGDWESLYARHMAPVPAALGRLRDALGELKLSDDIDLRAFTDDAHRALDARAREFETFFLGGGPAESAVTLSRLFTHIAPKHRKKLDPAAEKFVFLDGMRWDVWCHLRATLLPHLGAVFRVVDETPIWSVHPTTTKRQLDAAGIGVPELELAAEPRPDYAGRGDDAPPPGFRRLYGPNGEPIDRLNLIDDKVHESSAPLADLLREIELHARRALGAYLEDVPRRTLVFVFADHGFREEARWSESDRHRKPRYGHGGASPWEVVTPLAVLYRG